MARQCERFEHTADVGLFARADTLSELLEALAEGMADYICSRRQVRPSDRRTLKVQAEDVEALAVDFLSSVLATIQADRFVISSVSVSESSETGVVAELCGEPYDVTRHEIHLEVKAVTYHQLQVVREGNRWVGRVILDI